MNRQTGVIAVAYLLLASGIVGFGLGGTAAFKFQGMRLDTARAENKALQAQFDQFKTQVAAQGKAAQKRADLQTKQDLQAKEKANAQNKAARARDLATIAQLRRERDSSHPNIVSPSPGATASLDRATFDRPQLESALRSLLGNIRGIVDEGSAAVTDLDTAKLWASGLKLSRTLTTPTQ